MTIEITQTLTATGAGAAIDVGPPKNVSFQLVGNQTDFTANIEVQLVKGGTWGLGEASLADSIVKTTQGPIAAIRANISDLGTATTIAFEVLGERQ